VTTTFANGSIGDLMRLSKQVFKWQRRSMQRDAKSLFYLKNGGAKCDPEQTALWKCHLMQGSEQESRTEC